MLQILDNIFRLIKIKTKSFGFSSYNHIFFHYYNDLIKLLSIFLGMLTQKIFLISFFNLAKLFLAFTCTNNIESLNNSLFGDKIFNPFPTFTSSSSSFSGGVSDKPSSSDFYLLDFTLSAIVSSGCDLLFSSSFLYHSSYL